MRNHRWTKSVGALLIIGCIAVSGAAAAMALPDESTSVSHRPDYGVSVIDGAEPVSGSVPGIDSAVLAKQREIDAYVFGTEGSEELARRGFKATHTSPSGDRVEIGILPYEESYAEFLYDKFGRDQIVVVEGFEAVLMEGPMTILPAPAPEAQGGAEPAYPGGTAPSAGGGMSGSGGVAAPGAVPAVPEPVAPDDGGNQAGPVADPNQPVSSVPGGPAIDLPAFSGPGAADTAAGAAEAVPLSAEPIAKGSSPWTSPYLYAAIAAAATGLVIALLAARRKRTAAKNE